MKSISLLAIGLACSTALAPALAAPVIADHEILILEKLQSGSPTGPSVEAARKRLNRTAGAVDLVPAELFRQTYAQNLQDMLANTPGVFARQRFAEEVRLSIRGSGLSRGFHMRGIRLLLDGIPLTLADNSSDFQEVDPLTLRYVEVYKGANALRHGTANLGGAVQFVSPTGHTAESPALFSLEGGSFSTFRAHGSVAHNTEKLDYYVAATGSTSTGFRDQADQLNGRLSGNMGLKLGETAETRFYVAYNNINQEVPGTLSLTDALTNPKSVAPINILNDYARDIRSFRAANKTTVAIGAGSLDFGVYGFHKDLYHPIFQVIDQKTLEFGTFAQLDLPFHLAGHNARLVLGLNAGRGKTEALRYVNIGGNRGTLTADADQKARNLDVYGELRVETLPGLEVIAGGQFVHSTRRYEDNLNPAMSDRTGFESFSPRFGLLWQADDDVQVFANLSRSFETPTFSELVQFPVAGFVPLDAQRAWTWEIGSRGRMGTLAWDVAVYRASVRGEMLQFNVGQDIPASTFNAARTRHQGIELGLTAEIADDLVLRQTYTLNDFKFRGDPQYGNNRIAGLPKHLYRAELAYTHPSGFHVTPSMDWAMSRADVDFANTLMAPRYVVANLRTGFRFEDGLSLYAEARNIFDKKYVSSFSTLVDASAPGNLNVFYPGDGLAFFLGVRWGLGS